MESATPAALLKRAAFYAVGALFFINGICMANWLARVPGVRVALQLDDRELGFILLFAAIGSMASTRLTGRIVAHFGSRATCAVSGVAFCLAIMGPGWATSGPGLAAALFVLGFCSGVMDVSMNSQAVGLERRQKKAVLSRFHGLFSMGTMAGAGCGAAAVHAGLGLHLHLGLVAGAGALAVLVAGRALLQDHSRGNEPRTRLRFSRAIVTLAAVVFCSSVGEGAMADWVGIYLHDFLHTNLATAALGYTAFAITMVLGRFCGDWLSTRLGDERILRWGGAVVLLGLGGALWIDSLPAFFVGVACVGCGLSGCVPVIFRAAGRDPAIPTASALATLAVLGYSGFLVGPALIGMISHATSLRVGLGVVALLGVPITALSGVVRVSSEA